MFIEIVTVYYHQNVARTTSFEGDMANSLSGGMDGGHVGQQFILIEVLTNFYACGKRSETQGQYGSDSFLIL
jgi:hypothetical protein